MEQKLETFTSSNEELESGHRRLLELPPPEVDALGRPAWACTSSDISRAYRRLSALVHPDKNPNTDARAAFEALNRAHRLLKDPAKLVSSNLLNITRLQYSFHSIEDSCIPGMLLCRRRR